jgi:hypothetical protein
LRNRKHVSAIFAIGAVCVALGAVAFAGVAQAAVRHFDGVVVSKSSTAKTVTIRTEGGSKLTFKVTGATKFERIAGGFGGLAKGKAIEIDANNASGSWVATKIEPQGGNGGESGSGPGDDNGGHGNDDGPGHT